MDVPEPNHLHASFPSSSAKKHPLKNDSILPLPKRPKCDHQTLCPKDDAVNAIALLPLEIRRHIAAFALPAPDAHHEPLMMDVFLIEKHDGSLPSIRCMLISGLKQWLEIVRDQGRNDAGRGMDVEEVLAVVPVRAVLVRTPERCHAPVNPAFMPPGHPREKSDLINMVLAHLGANASRLGRICTPDTYGIDAYWARLQTAAARARVFLAETEISPELADKMHDGNAIRQICVAEGVRRVALPATKIRQVQIHGASCVLQETVPPKGARTTNINTLRCDGKWLTKRCLSNLQPHLSALRSMNVQCRLDLGVIDLQIMLTMLPSLADLSMRGAKLALVADHQAKLRTLNLYRCLLVARNARWALSIEQCGMFSFQGKCKGSGQLAIHTTHGAAHVSLCHDNSVPVPTRYAAHTNGVDIRLTPQAQVAHLYMWQAANPPNTIRGSRNEGLFSATIRPAVHPDSVFLGGPSLQMAFPPAWRIPATTRLHMNWVDHRVHLRRIMAQAEAHHACASPVYNNTRLHLVLESADEICTPRWIQTWQVGRFPFRSLCLVFCEPFVHLNLPVTCPVEIRYQCNNNNNNNNATWIRIQHEEPLIRAAMRGQDVLVTSGDLKSATLDAAECTHIVWPGPTPQ